MYKTYEIKISYQGSICNEIVTAKNLAEAVIDALIFYPGGIATHYRILGQQTQVG